MGALQVHAWSFPIVIIRPGPTGFIWPKLASAIVAPGAGSMILARTPRHIITNNSKIGRAAVRILLVIDSLAVGGAERHVADLALGLHARGHHVVVASAAPGPLQADLAKAGIPVHMLGLGNIKRRVSLAFAYRLRSLLHRSEIEVVHAHLFAGTAASTLAASGLSCVVVLTVHSEGIWQGSFARVTNSLVYRRSQGLIAVSHPIAQLLVSRHRIPADRVTVIGNSLNTSAAVVPRLSRSPSTRGPLLGVIARLLPEKGVDVFLAAFSHVVVCHPRAQAVVVGDGPQACALRRQAQELGVGRRVHFLGCVPEARGLLPSLDLLVMPSRSEGSPLVILEAMAAGVAIVATRVGDVPRQLQDGRDGVLVSPNDPKAMSGAISQLLNDPHRRRRLASAGKARFARDFPYDAVLDHVESVYSAAIARKRWRELSCLPGVSAVRESPQRRSRPL